MGGSPFSTLRRNSVQWALNSELGNFSGDHFRRFHGRKRGSGLTKELAESHGELHRETFGTERLAVLELWIAGETAMPLVDEHDVVGAQLGDIDRGDATGRVLPEQRVW